MSRNAGSTHSHVDYFHRWKIVGMVRFRYRSLTIYIRELRRRLELQGKGKIVRTKLEATAISGKVYVWSI